MRFDWRGLQPLSGPRQILAHQVQCAFDAVMIAGLPMRSFACSLEIPYLNQLTHSLSALLRIDPCSASSRLKKSSRLLLLAYGLPLRMGEIWKEETSFCAEC